MVVLKIKQVLANLQRKQKAKPNRLQVRFKQQVCLGHKYLLLMGELALETPDESNEFFRTGVILPEKPVLRQVWRAFGLLSH